MTGEIAEEPLARAVLKHLAATRDDNDPVGSFARTVINGEATLRGAADFPWHNQALAAGAVDAQHGQQNMTAEQRAEVAREADRLRTTPTIEEEQR